jgi:hypothetical protein
MANDSDEILIGANGSIRVAPVGNTEPANIAAAWPAGWVDLGFASEDGVKVTDSKGLGQVDVWQSFYPARRFVTDRDMHAAFVLRQWNIPNVKLAFGGGTVTEDVADSGHFRYVPPDPEDLDEHALGIQWADGAKNYRLIIPRGIVTEDVETTLARSAPADLPITFGITAQDGDVPWFLLTDDPAFDPAP